MLRDKMIRNTSVTEFVLLGFSSHPDMNSILFLVFLCVYIITVLGNILIVVVIYVDPALHTPMYFFLRNLSFLDIFYTSVTLPKMLANHLSENKTISFANCAVQMFFFLFFGVTECFLLASMAYDRYSAICNPLRYTAIMNKRVCIQLTAGSWVCGILAAVEHTATVFTLPFCGSNVINHFFCDIQPVLKLVCWDTYWIEVHIIVGVAFTLMMPLLLSLLSYICIISTILKIRSAEGRRRTFSTCSSHLIVVTLCYGTALIIYARPKSSYGLGVNKLFSLFYSVGIAILNPIIYSFRNKEVKDALRKMTMNIF
ncbi:olfactory receptor 10C1-like [Emydura macquarii macquarii]|uniref:olfactory receptor 10C1-like n=1 Tax=Emydura macquarii macquarii TaxID=1129001 RepID=UPI00352A555C